MSAALSSSHSAHVLSKPEMIITNTHTAYTLMCHHNAIRATAPRPHSGFHSKARPAHGVSAGMARPHATSCGGWGPGARTRFQRRDQKSDRAVDRNGRSKLRAGRGTALREACGRESPVTRRQCALDAQNAHQRSEDAQIHVKGCDHAARCALTQTEPAVRAWRQQRLHACCRTPRPARY